MRSYCHRLGDGGGAMAGWFSGWLSSSRCELASAEGNDAADGIVRGNPNGDSVPGDHLDAEAAHAAAQLRENFVARINLDAIKPAAVNCHDRALDINEVVLAQICCPFIAISIAGPRPHAAYSFLTASSTCLASAG